MFYGSILWHIIREGGSCGSCIPHYCDRWYEEVMCLNVCSALVWRLLGGSDSFEVFMFALM
jgi:hypothetical protein